MNKRYKKAIELDKILHMLADEAVCPETKETINNLEPFQNADEVRMALEETDLMLKMVLKYGSPRLSAVLGATKACERAVKGGVLSMAELLLIAAALRNFKYLKSWYQQEETEITVLENIFYSITPHPQLEKTIYNSVISETEMADTASGTLLDIRQKIRNTESSIRNKLDGIIKGQLTQKYLQDSVIALRSGRFVVPVKSEHKGDLQGVIHDVSSSGSTLFVEPTAVVEANAKILQLKNMEQEEIQRILEAFSTQVATISEIFLQSYENMLYADLLCAKAKLALIQNANKPFVEYNSVFSLVYARHPLIDKEKVVAVDIALGKDYDTMVITGPNTGGKTVTLKTAGLLCAMAQHGMLIPAHETSSVCVFSDILVDIGDEQSIEQSLSTFSGHMKNVTEILTQADSNTLVLLDELGAGTDPAEGAALAVAIIENLRKTKTKIMATTHYGEMKIFALETEGVQNASCEFNVESLRPTYKLSVGVPGKSNAFLIGEKLGIPMEVINLAKLHLSQEDKRFDTVLNQLEDLKSELNNSRQEIEELKSSAENQLTKAKQKSDDIIAQGQRELDAARAKAKAVANDVQTEAYKLLDEMKQLQKQENMSAQQKAIRAREIARKDSEKLYLKSDVVYNPQTTHMPLETAKKGEKVIVASLNKQAIVIQPEDKNNMVELMMGMIKTKINLSELCKLDNSVQAEKKKFVPRPKTGTSEIAQKPRTSAMEINLLGLNVDEAIIEADGFIDNAVMTGLHTIYLIHGKGTGALRDGLHKHLKTHRNIKSYRLGNYGEGESGVTVAELK